MTWYKHSVERWALRKAIERRLMYSGGTIAFIDSIKALELALTSTRYRQFYLEVPFSENRLRKDACYSNNHKPPWVDVPSRGFQGVILNIHPFTSRSLIQ
jgi:hypothetical protein